jgi:hypothetical protein
LPSAGVVASAAIWREPRVKTENSDSIAAYLHTWSQRITQLRERDSVANNFLD